MTHDWVQRGKEVLDVEMEGLACVKESLGPEFHKAVELLAACTGRVVITGIGKSGLVGRKIAATLSSTGTPSFFLHPVEGAHGDLGSIRKEDAVIAISYSGKTDELNALLPSLRSLGVPVVSITSGLDSKMAELSDIVLNVRIPREACPMNLAPTTSTTATLALGDALAVCLIDHKSFTPQDFRVFHPGGALGQRLALKVQDIMQTDNLPALPDTCLFGEAVRVLDKGRMGAVLFTDNAGKLSGILTDGDVRRAFCRGAVSAEAPVSALMTKAPRHALPEQSAAELMDIMEEKMITVLPVVAEDLSLLGLVHLHDLLGKGRVKFAG